MSTLAIVMMVFMLVVYFGGFIYFALRKEPEESPQKKSKKGE